MYTIERGQIYTSGFPDVSKAKMKIVGTTRRILTTAMGREFMALPTRHKVYTLYFLSSFLLIFAWDETHVWPNILNVMNFANAGRLANKVIKGMSARD